MRSHVFVCLALVWCSLAPFSQAVSRADEPAEVKWRTLFNGKDLDDWKATDFGGEGNVDVKDKLLILSVGEPLTGVTWKGDELPKENYELVCRAQRMEGLDFFCGITFPIGESHASFIPAGWSGGVTGLSSINGYDASENETTTYVKFENKKWYDFKIQVTGKTVVVFVDKDRVIRITREGKKINTRIEVDLSKPLGLAAFRSKGAIETLKIRDLSAAEIAEIDKPVK